MKKIDKLEKEVWRLRDEAVTMALKFKREGYPLLSREVENMIVAYDCVIYAIKEVKK